jgi:hypothetical protein
LPGRFVFDREEEPLLVVSGDLNAGPGMDFFERYYLMTSGLDALMGSPFNHTKLLEVRVGRPAHRKLRGQRLCRPRPIAWALLNVGPPCGVGSLDSIQICAARRHVDQWVSRCLPPPPTPALAFCGPGLNWAGFGRMGAVEFNDYVDEIPDKKVLLDHICVRLVTGCGRLGDAQTCRGDALFLSSAAMPCTQPPSGQASPTPSIRCRRITLGPRFGRAMRAIRMPALCGRHGRGALRTTGPFTQT